MEPKPSVTRLTQKQSAVEQTLPAQSAITNSNARDFNSVEELLRWDTDQTPPPPTLGAWLRRTINREPRPARSLWARILGRGQSDS